MFYAIDPEYLNHVLSHGLKRFIHLLDIIDHLPKNIEDNSLAIHEQLTQRKTVLDSYISQIQSAKQRLEKRLQQHNR